MNFYIKPELFPIEQKTRNDLWSQNLSVKQKKVQNKEIRLLLTLINQAN